MCIRKRSAVDIVRPRENEMYIPAYRASLGSSVLSQSADAYVGYLQQQQYCPSTIRAYLRGIENFAGWLTRRRILLRALDKSLMRQFVLEHLPMCRCPDPCQRSVTSVRPALAHLFRLLREESFLSEPQPLFSPDRKSVV